MLKEQKAGQKKMLWLLGMAVTGYLKPATAQFNDLDVM
jgi:hypothetical protein